MSESNNRLVSFINNNPVSVGDFFIKTNPFNGEPLYQVASADLMNVVTAVQGAQKFFQEYKSSHLVERKKILEKIKSVIGDHLEKWSRQEALDQGLPVQFVKDHSFKPVLKFIDEALIELESHGELSINLAPESGKNPSPSAMTQKLFSPVGVVTILGSWNLSFRNILENLIPAIAAGNTCVVKVSSSSPVTARILSDLIQQAELPVGLVHILVSQDHSAVKALLTHPSVKAVVSIGQLQTSQQVMKDVSSVSHQSFKKMKIHSGTKNSAVALADPNEQTFQKIMDSFLIGQGQLAWNSTRLFVIEKYESQWVERIKAELNLLKPSEGIDDPSRWTPIIKKSSFESFGDVMKQAQSDQGHLLQTTEALTSGSQHFLPVTFTKDMSNCSTLQQDQVHSPLFILSTVKYPFDVPKYTNVSYFGFAAHLFGDPEKMGKISEALDVGLVCQNKWSVQVFNSFKAVKQSGFGIQDSKVFGDFFSNVKILT